MLLLVGGDEGAGYKAPQNPNVDVLEVGNVDEVRPYYAAMDVLVLPSLREGFPNVVLEAAAMSVPAVVTDATGVFDSVVDQETGVIVPVGDVEALAGALRTLSEDPELRARYGAAARHRVETDFAQEDIWEQTLKAFLSQ